MNVWVPEVSRSFVSEAGLSHHGCWITMITSVHVGDVHAETTCLDLDITNHPIVVVVNARGEPKPSPS